MQIVPDYLGNETEFLSDKVIVLKAKEEDLHLSIGDVFVR